MGSPREKNRAGFEGRLHVFISRAQRISAIFVRAAVGDLRQPCGFYRKSRNFNPLMAGRKLTIARWG